MLAYGAESKMIAPIKYRKIINNFVNYTILLLVIGLALIPIIWMVDTSFKPTEDIMIWPPKLITPHMNIKSYIYIFTGEGFEDIYPMSMPPSTHIFPRYFMNSVAYCSITTLVAITMTFFAAYSIARMDLPGKRYIFIGILITRLLPGASIMVPMYRWFDSLHILNTVFGLMLAYLIITLPLTIWLLVGYLENIPREFEEAAMVDGCSRLGVIFKIILPIAMHGVIAVMLFAFVNIWNEFMFSTVFIHDFNKFPLSVGIMNYVEESYADWGIIMAASSISTIPVLAFFLLIRKYFVEGLTRGAIKG